MQNVIQELVKTRSSVDYLLAFFVMLAYVRESSDCNVKFLNVLICGFLIQTLFPMEELFQLLDSWREDQLISKIFYDT